MFSDAVANQLIKALGLTSLSDLVITPMEGGITNQNYRLETATDCFVLRLGGENTELLGINRAREHAASAIAADLGIGAPVVHSDAKADILITRFISGAVLTPEQAAQPERLKKIAECLRCYHNGPDFYDSFSPFVVVRTYHQLALDRGVNFPDQTAQALSVMDQIEAAIGPPPKLQPCHNDLLAANFIDDGTRMRLIDWEYAAMGDPFFDLGNFAVNQELSRAACQQLLQYYFGQLRAGDLARMQLMRVASDLRESFWGFLQSAISKLDFDFSQYGLKHLDRFLQNSREQQFQTDLKECQLNPR